MRRIVSIGISTLALLLAVGGVEAQQGMMGMEMRSPISWEKSPGIGAALSLTPLPVALGNFYAGDWKRGILYTTIEVALAIPAMAMLAERYGHHHNMWHDEHHDDDHEGWSKGESARFAYLVTGFVVVKLVSAFDAGYSIEQQNRRLSLSLEGHRDGLRLALRTQF